MAVRDDEKPGGALRAGPTGGDGSIVRVFAPTAGQWFDVGDLITAQATFTDPTQTAAPVDPVNGFTLITPPVVLALVTLPGGSTVAPAVTSTQTGYYQAQLTVSKPGIHWFRFYVPSGDTYQGVGEQFFQVHRQRAGTSGPSGAPAPPAGAFQVNDSAGILAPLLDGAGNQLVNIPPFEPNTTYPGGYVIQRGGGFYSANVTFVSGATFNAANWTLQLPPSVVTGSPRADGGNPQLRSPIIEGLPITGYGNSYLWMNQAPLFAQRRYFDRVQQRMLSGAALNNGINGACSHDASVFAHGTVAEVTNHGTVAGTWTPAATNGGAVILEVVRNDAGWDGFSSSAKARLGFTNSLDSLIRLVRASSALQDTNAAFVYTGTWTSAAATTHPGGSSHHTSTPGDKVTITTPAGTDFDLILMGFDTAFAGASFTVSVDGVDITASLAAAGYPTTTAAQFNQSKVQQASWTPLAVPLRGLSNAVHTVVLTHTGASGALLYVCRLLTQSPTPPTILIPKCPQLLALGYSAYVGSTASWATDQIYNGLIDTEVARWPADQSVVSWDPNAHGWNPNTMIYSGDGQGLHPNDLGSACYADGIMAVLNALPARSGLIAI